MKELLIAVAFVAILVIAVLVAMVLFLKDVNKENESSKNIVYHFEPDNTSYKLTDMIEFYKKREHQKSCQEVFQSGDEWNE